MYYCCEVLCFCLYRPQFIVNARISRLNSVFGKPGELYYGLNKNIMRLYIKFMISMQCKDLVKEELHKLKIPYVLVNLGTVDLLEDLTLKQRKQLKINLLSLGFKLHEAKKGILIEKIKNTILEMIQYSDGHPVMTNSVYLSLKLNYDYTYLANIFSEVNGMSIQQYIILNKIEKIKDLLLKGDLNLSEISYQLHYSSVAHLSGQFKKTTGISPTGYKLMMKKGEEKLETN